MNEQLIGIAISNTPPLMTIWGGAEKMIGNQPLSIAVPAGKNDAFVLDQMFGSVRLNVPRDAAAEGTQLPAGVVVDADGAPTTDPARYLDGGALLPIGGHRGSGVALMAEVLTSVLAGGPMLNRVTGPGSPDKQAGHSLYLMALDPVAMLPGDDFLHRMDEFIEQIQTAKPAPGVDRVRVPGTDREALAVQRAREGIPVPADHVALLRNLAAELGVTWPG
jgi:LDH2 family malate/lactate/ureidoglycolate dehydrogenase